MSDEARAIIRAAYLDGAAIDEIARSAGVSLARRRDLPPLVVRPGVPGGADGLTIGPGVPPGGGILSAVIQIEVTTVADRDTVVGLARTGALSGLLGRPFVVSFEGRSVADGGRDSTVVYIVPVPPPPVCSHAV